jgi:RsiW-degrading membrane proteinase PrsW (M82 family)
MPIELQCECGRWLRFPDAAAGGRAVCPACRRQFDVPAVVTPVATSLEELFAPSPAPPPTDDGLYEFADDPDRAAREAADRAAAAERKRLRELAEQQRTGSKPLPVWLNNDNPYVQPPPRPVKLRPAPARAPAQALAPEPLAGPPGRPYRYLILLLALIPLAWSTIRPEPKDDVENRIAQTVNDHPEIEDKVNNANSLAEVCAAMPGDRIEGALLPHDTYAHWGIAALSGGLYFGLVLLVFPLSQTKVWPLLIVSIFTGTAGIIVLLAFQWIAFHVPLYTGANIAVLIIDLIWLIGQSYRLTLEHHGLIVTALGFTAGVGFCEETCKALPLIYKARTDGFYSWRSAMIWGLMSGVGFGVSEGITYSHQYNGVFGLQIYLIRFISCVALHAIWAAATGINIFRRQDYFRGQMHVLEWVQQIGITIIVPMFLHGMYDTLLTQEYDWAALLVALLSFGWLAYQIELAKRQLDDFQMRVAG